MMQLPDWNILNVVIDGLAHGLLGWSWQQNLIYALVMTHITIVAVTLFLHRMQAHRSLDLHPIAAHFFRFWLWLTTGMVTTEWVAIHRKHHAKCETADDPHSPQTRGLKTVLSRGAELYRAESLNAQTLKQFGHGTPNDWVERNVYSRFSWQGVAIMLLIDVLLCGALGATVWAVQMLWIPFWAAGVVNGVGHHTGYRNFEAPDASTNLLPWGIVIGGEELHNNHHTYPTSAKFSIKPYEFDVGWMYITLLKKIGGATVKKVPPKLQWGDPQALADGRTLEALIANRYEVMAGYARDVRTMCRLEMQALQAKHADTAVLKTGQRWLHRDALQAKHADTAVLKTAQRWLHRDADKVPVHAQRHIDDALATYPVLQTMITMREELRQLWLNTTQSREQLIVDLQAWCTRAENSGIAALHDFSCRLRSVRLG